MHDTTTSALRRPLKVGIQLPEVEYEVRWSEQLDMIRAIEDLGFDSIWLGEHLLYRWQDRPPSKPDIATHLAMPASQAHVNPDFSSQSVKESRHVR